MREEEINAEIEDFIEGFNQPTYRGMRVNGQRIATWSSQHGWSGDSRPEAEWLTLSHHARGTAAFLDRVCGPMDRLFLSGLISLITKYEPELVALYIPFGHHPKSCIAVFPKGVPVSDLPIKAAREYLRSRYPLDNVP